MTPRPDGSDLAESTEPTAASTALPFILICCGVMLGADWALFTAASRPGS